MTSQWARIINFIALFLLLILSGGLQTTLWYQFFGSVPAPLLWLILVVYVILYRPARAALVTIYLMGFAILSFSALSLGMIFSNLLILYILVSNLKSRFYWGGVGYFTLMCLIASFAFHIFYLLSSYVIESQPAELLILHRLAQIVVTPIFSILYFSILKKLDHWTITEEIFADTGASTYE